MRVGRIPPEEPRGFCHACHNRAVIEASFGNTRPPLRLCAKCSKYLGDFLLRRLAEHNSGMPIPKASDRDNRGNR